MQLHNVGIQHTSKSSNYNNSTKNPGYDKLNTCDGVMLMQCKVNLLIQSTQIKLQYVLLLFKTPLLEEPKLNQILNFHLFHSSFSLFEQEGNY